LDASNHDTVASRHWQYYAGDIGKLITESLEIYLIGITDGETPDRTRDLAKVIEKAVSLHFTMSADHNKYAQL
jgi:hypothetical protein